MFCVAPVRERGLKWGYVKEAYEDAGSRSREGAWIEILPLYNVLSTAQRRSREGAWIEIAHCTREFLQKIVAPVRERGLKCLPIGHIFQ